MTEAELYTVYKGLYVPTIAHSPQGLKYFEEFSFRPDDVVIATYPKSGTTWMKEIIPLIQSDGDPASVEILPNWDRVPWLEESIACTLNLEQRPSPRVFASHFHYNMMPSSFFQAKPKVVYVMRNPKDVFTSYFHYHRMASFLVRPGPQSEFLHKFLEGKVMFGSWFDHMKSWLSAQDKERIFYISYEEMILDLKDSIWRIAQFLDKSLDAEVIEKIVTRCEFKNMKQNKMSNYSLVPPELMDQTKSEFLRKGEILDKVIRKASSVLGSPLDSVQELGERRMMAKLSALLENTSHSMTTTVSCNFILWLINLMPLYLL